MVLSDGRASKQVKPPGLAPLPVPVIDAERLFAGGNEVRLVHRGQEYRLSITRQGKLILTK